MAFRQGVSPLELDGVLCGNDHERPRQRIALAVGRHLPLAHRLQQCALCAGRGPIDLVGQHDVGENRAGAERELARLAVVEAAARNVGRQQVGRELDAMELAGQTAGDGLAHQGLAHAGHVFQQDVFAGQEGHHGQPHGIGLAEDHAGNVLLQQGDQVGCFVCHYRDRRRRVRVTLLIAVMYTTRPGRARNRGGAPAILRPRRVQIFRRWRSPRGRAPAAAGHRRWPTGSPRG